MKFSEKEISCRALLLTALVGLKLIEPDQDDLSCVSESVFAQAQNRLSGEELEDFIDNKEKYDLFKTVVQQKSNQETRSSGAYLFKFYTLGEWRHVMIDGSLPIKLDMKKSGKFMRRGRAFVADQIEEFWALLLEKAFAKLGCPFCRAKK